MPAVRIEYSVIMMGGDNTPGWAPTPSGYCEDVTALINAPGGRSAEEPADKPDGGLVAELKDYAANIWWIST